MSQGTLLLWKVVNWLSFTRLKKIAPSLVKNSEGRVNNEYAQFFVER